MNKYLSSAVIMALCTALIPAGAVYFTKAPAAGDKPEQPAVSAVIPEGEMPEDTQQTVPSASAYRVLDTSTGLVSEVTVRDYIIGAAAAEMPATFEPEAIKAQMVAAHTYAERQRLREQSSPTPQLCGADFSNDPAKYQGFFTDSQMQHYYGENYDAYYAKLSAAADEAERYILTYGGEPIIAAFHSISAGKTESAANAGGTYTPYLVPADSSSDTAAPTYLEEKAFSRDLLAARLTKSFEGIELGDDFTEWIKVRTVSDSGTVMTASVGDTIASGNDIREALGLRSACFEIAYTADEAIFTTKGFGHGVGMSQYGANELAKAGGTWREILSHYYTGCEIAETVPPAQ